MSSAHIAHNARSALRFAVLSAAFAFTTGCMMFMRPPKGPRLLAHAFE
jgi:hypothetical protein